MTTLRGCLDAAKEAILGGARDRAIDLCFHILGSFPKCIEAHCLLGEAYREKGLAAQSENTLRRVLSADPENLVARWAISILEEDKGDIDSAETELRRAFELSPGHSELRRELARLSQKDVFLTRGALGRIYARGEMFDRAVLEFRAVLAEEPGRLDIMVALAEALWRDRQFSESRAVCQMILADSPDCLKANIILGHILLMRGESDKTGKYLGRAEMLDPENAVAELLLDGMEVETLLEHVDVELPAFEAVEDTWEAGEATPAIRTQPEDAFEAETFEHTKLLADLGFLSSEANLPLASETELVVIEEPQTSEVEEPQTSVAEEAEVFSAIGASEPSVIEAFKPSMMDEQLVDPDDLEEIATDVVLEPNENLEEDRELEELNSFSVDADHVVDTGEVGQAYEHPLMREAIPLADSATNGAHGAGIEETAKSAEDYIQIYLQKVQAHPDDFQAHLELALAYHRSSQADLAVAEFELVLKSAPDLVDRVIEGLRALLSSNPGHMLAHRRLGDAYMKAGRFQEAIDCYNLCLSKQRSSNPSVARSPI